MKYTMFLCCGLCVFLILLCVCVSVRVCVRAHMRAYLAHITSTERVTFEANGSLAPLKVPQTPASFQRLPNPRKGRLTPSKSRSTEGAANYPRVSAAEQAPFFFVPSMISESF